ncbi:MAG: TIGR00730 family Rossman fold protein [Paludibacteraceae bacterium]|nr:TIGR00730 family Rossman fold protein [Paludibacteraceae bacterium]
MKHDIHTVCVFCASSNQSRPSYYAAAKRLGEILAEEHIRLVYGDGGIGLMGSIADGALSKGGTVIGVIPQFMVDEGWNNPKSTETHVVQTMHERKAYIESISDAMIALPGGIGTLEELAECLTWKQLGIHTKPVVILNTDGYYDPLLAYLDRMVEENMMREIHRTQMFTVVNTPEEVLPALRNAPEWNKTIRREAAI